MLWLASDIYRNTGIASLGQNLFGDSRYDLNEAWMNHHIEVLSGEVSDASYYYSRYAFPLLGGVWTQNLVEKYFSGMRDKLSVQYVDREGMSGIESEYLGYSSAEGKFGLENFLGGFDDWFTSSHYGMRATNLDPSWNPIVTKTQAKRYREYVFAKLAKDAGIPLQNAERVLKADEKTPMFLWDSGDSVPLENLNNPPLFTNLTVEKTKIIHIKGLLQGLADLILGDIEVLEYLGIEYEPPGVGDTSSISSGASCYPDLDLPSHPYYGNSLYAMNPDFYYWNIYDDATGTQQRDILERAEAAVMKAVEGPYNMLKSMQRDGLDSSEYADVYGYMDVGNDSLVPAVTKLVSQHEASDEVEARWYPPGDGEGVRGAPVWIGTGETHQNIAAVNMFTKEGKISPEYTAYLDRGKVGFEALQAEVDKIKDNRTKNRAQKDLDKLKAYQERQQVFPPLLSNWHGNPLYQPTGEELDYYTELSKKIVNTESFFGSRLGYVGGLQDPDDDSSEGLNDTKLAALAEYKMVFDPESLKRLAIDSSKDILSQKYTMKRAFPTFKLYFVEEDEIYNRVLAFDDFHAYNGVKEFTVQQSRKNPADTATIVLQNVSGTLDGTKRSVITDLDYYKVDESGNFKDPSEKLTANTIANNSATDENGIITSADKPLPTRPAWVDNKSQPFGAVILRPGLNVQLRAGYSNDPNMLNVLISGRVVDVQWSTNGDLVEIVVQSFGTELVKYLKGRGNSYGAGGESDSDTEVYPTTHQLLSSLMLSPELSILEDGLEVVFSSLEKVKMQVSISLIMREHRISRILRQQTL